MKKCFLLTTFMTCLVFTFVFLHSCKKEDVAKVDGSKKDAVRISSSVINCAQIQLVNDRLVFPDFNSLIELINANADGEAVQSFKEHVNSLGIYTPADFSASVEFEADDVLQGYFFNNDGLVQVGSTLIKLDVESNEYRFINVIHEADLLDELLSGMADQNISRAALPNRVKPDGTYRIKALGACIYCGLGAVGTIVTGGGAGILEVIACIHCYRANS